MNHNLRILLLIPLVSLVSCTQSYNVNKKQLVETITLEPSRSVSLATEKNTLKPKVKVVIVLDESASMKQNAFEKLKIAITKLNQDLKGFNYDLDFYTTTLLANNSSGHISSTRSSMQATKNYFDKNGAPMSGSLETIQNGRVFPANIESSYILHTGAMGYRSYEFSDTMTEETRAENNARLSAVIDNIPGTGSVEQGLIVAGSVLSSLKAGYSYAWNTITPEDVFAEKYSGGAIIFLTDEDNTNSQDQNFSIKTTSVPTAKKVFYQPTIRKNLTTLRIRALKPALRDGEVIKTIEDVYAGYDFFGLEEASSFPISMSESGVATICNEADKNAKFIFPNPGDSSTSSPEQLAAVKAGILRKFPNADLSEMTNYQAFCIPMGAEVRDGHMRIALNESDLPYDLCEGGVLASNYSLLESPLRNLFYHHWLYGNNRADTWDIVAGGICDKGIDFAESETSRKTLIKDLMPSAGVKNTLSDAILDRIEKRFGANRFLLGGLVLTNDATSCSKTGTKGTQYINLIERYMKKNPKLGFVHDICQAESFSLGTSQLSNFIKEIALDSYDIAKLVSKEELLKGVSIKRSGKLISVGSSQYNGENNLLKFNAGVLQPDDEIILHLYKEVKRQTYK